VKTMYDSYYTPSAIADSRGKGIVLVGYGSYFGYLDISYAKGADDEDTPLVGASGHTIQEGPLVDIHVEDKNADFAHILSIVESKLKGNDPG